MWKGLYVLYFFHKWNVSLICLWVQHQIEPRHKKTCLCHMRTTSAQSDQRLCYSLARKYAASSFCIWNFKTLTSTCSLAGRFKSHLVENPKDRFSRRETQLYYFSVRITVHPFSNSNRHCRKTARHSSVACRMFLFELPVYKISIWIIRRCALVSLLHNRLNFITQMDNELRHVVVESVNCLRQWAAGAVKT